MDYAGQRITVMGLGRFGGGVGVTRFLSARGATVTVTDTSPPEDLAESVTAVRDLPGVSLILGEHREQDFRDADLVVANPAVKPTNEYLQIAHDAGVPVTTEIVLLVRELPNRLRTIGITGSAGKSTTTAMIGHILRRTFEQEGDAPDPSRHAPGVWVGGNLGGSLLPTVDQIRDDDWVVLELSSFMLHYLREEKWSPHIAVVTNLLPNHLDWHGAFEEYAACKQAIFDYQCDADADFALGGDGTHDSFQERIECGRTWLASAGGEFRTSPPLSLRTPGSHNQTNACLAAWVVQAALGGTLDIDAKDPGLSLYAAWAALKDFAGLPHRLSYVGELMDVPAEAGTPGCGGVRCFNDSKSTTPEAAALAMEAFASGTVHAILGGHDKGADLAEMCGVAAERCAGVYTIGATGDAIADTVETAGGDAIRSGTLENAVAATRANVRPGDVVLLSPGCASWDQFANYEERGNRFIALVRGDA
ncbi:MAG: UDP-N-acetylmuramoyl-L-alanine--D-glutamate ligase [Planctomycetota bacterium]